MSYKAIVARIHTRPLPGSDNIVLGTCGAYQVIVGKDTPDGCLGIFFEQGGQLSEELATVHDLVRRKDEDGNPCGGFFEPNRRVKAIKLRGARSEGFWVPLEHVAYTGYDLSQLREGDQFDELKGHKLCQKYFTPATLRQQRGAKNNRGETPMFPKHVDYEAFKRGAGIIPKGAAIYLTEKVHGTSGRLGHVLDDVIEPRGKLAEFLARLFRKPPKVTRKWCTLNGSRNVILERKAEGETGFYGKEAFRYLATEKITLRKGEMIFFELAGYTDTGQPIMAAQNLEALKDKSLQKRFGKEIVYRYGCIPGQCRLLVYRITLTNEDGQSEELSWPRVAARCRELGLEPVPPTTDPATGEPVPPFVYDGDLEKLAELVTRITGDEGLPSSLDPSHIQEGVVLRAESEYGTLFLKNKGFCFGVLEGYLKEKDDYVDLEESA